MPSKRSTTPAICQHCGITFFPFVNAQGKFCSQRCNGAQRKRSLADRLWGQVTKTESCWLHQGSKNSRGYGRVGSDDHGHGMRLAHRVAWEVTYGPIPAGLSVLHRCDNPACCRPDHLFLGTQSDNMRDMVTKGRHAAQRYPDQLPRGDRHWSSQHPEWVRRGEGHGQAKLTADDVRAIRRLHAEGNTLASIAARFGMSPGHTWSIVHRASWSHVLP